MPGEREYRHVLQASASIVPDFTSFALSRYMEQNNLLDKDKAINVLLFKADFCAVWNITSSHGKSTWLIYHNYRHCIKNGLHLVECQFAALSIKYVWHFFNRSAYLMNCSVCKMSQNSEKAQGDIFKLLVLSEHPKSQFYWMCNNVKKLKEAAILFEKL